MPVTLSDKLHQLGMSKKDIKMLKSIFNKEFNKTISNKDKENLKKQYAQKNTKKKGVSQKRKPMQKLKPMTPPTRPTRQTPSTKYGKKTGGKVHMKKKK